jgi:GcrA cell cycle regulator
MRRQKGWPCTWTEERIEKLKQLYGEGLSFDQIATELGDGLTRNAAIGKVHRLGLPLRGRWLGGRAGKQERKPREPRAKPRKAPPAPSWAVPTVPAAAPPKLEPVAPSVGLLLEELRPSHCRFALGGEAARAPYRFCARRVEPGLSWCAEHCRVVFTVRPPMGLWRAPR